ncbi:MAG: PIN domain-containing protein [Candidatus Melainabacteria bacterium]|nr:PIN domain-containing protein [Candidatus Melainabacteria bacterium]
MPFSAVYDACVLYPFEIRDMLMVAARTRYFPVYWTDEILDECARNLIADGRATREGMDRMFRDMKALYRRATIPRADYEYLIDSMTCDEGDRHVLAAAVSKRIDVIVTYNHKHFPIASLAPHGIESLSPDDFILDVLDLGPELFLSEFVARSQQRNDWAARNGKPEVTPERTAKYLAEGPMPKTGRFLLDVLK